MLRFCVSATNAENGDVNPNSFQPAAVVLSACDLYFATRSNVITYGSVMGTYAGYERRRNICGFRISATDAENGDDGPNSHLLHES